jgi:hypothetical protein
MVGEADLEVLIKHLQRALEQAKAVKLKHLQYLVSMALMEAEQQLPGFRPALRVVSSDAGRLD